jgi:viologen exporter family transport system permease protein
MNGLRLYARYTAVSIRAQMQYPASFLMLTSGQFLTTITEFVGIWALFSRFGNVMGWTLPQIALFYGTVNIAFAIADMACRGFDIFGAEFVKTGNFDRILLRPRSTVLQLIGHELRLTRFGRLLQGALVLGIAVAQLDLSWGLPQAALFAVALAGGAALFVGLIIMQATLCFWSVESLEIGNTLTYGGMLAAQYPMSIYSGWFRDFFTLVVPVACVAYFPIVGVLGIEEPLGAPQWLLYASPLAGFVFLAAALVGWQFGVRHYTSTGS